MRGLFTLLFLLLSLALRQTFAQSDGDETKIIALENLWNQIQIAHDGDAMEKMLDDAFVLTDFDGSFLNKAQFPRHHSRQIQSAHPRDHPGHEAPPPRRHRSRNRCNARKGRRKRQALRTPRPLYRHLDQTRHPMAMRSQPTIPNPQHPMIGGGARQGPSPPVLCGTANLGCASPHVRGCRGVLQRVPASLGWHRSNPGKFHTTATH